MKSQIKVFTLMMIVSIFTSCDVTLSYDESSQGAILEKDLSISPQHNLKNYLQSAGATYSNVKILNEGGGNCACTILSGTCTCKLNNAEGANSSCEDVNSKCTKLKVVQIDVSEEDVSNFSSLGFK